MNDKLKKVLSYIGVAFLGALIGCGALVGVSSCASQNNKKVNNNVVLKDLNKKYVNEEEITTLNVLYGYQQINFDYYYNFLIDKTEEINATTFYYTASSLNSITTYYSLTGCTLTPNLNNFTKIIPMRYETSGVVQEYRLYYYYGSWSVIRKVLYNVSSGVYQYYTSSVGSSSFGAASSNAFDFTINKGVDNLEFFNFWYDILYPSNSSGGSEDTPTYDGSLEYDYTFTFNEKTLNYLHLYL